MSDSRLTKLLDLRDALQEAADGFDEMIVEASNAGNRARLKIAEIDASLDELTIKPARPEWPIRDGQFQIPPEDYLNHGSFSRRRPDEPYDALEAQDSKTPNFTSRWRYK